MVYIRLARDWTDATGTPHHAGEMVDVDAVTLAELEATGVVAPVDKSQWAGPTDTGPGTQWAGPTGDGT